MGNLLSGYGDYMGVIGGYIGLRVSQRKGPILVPPSIRCRNIRNNQKVPRILRTTHTGVSQNLEKTFVGVPILWIIVILGLYWLPPHAALRVNMHGLLVYLLGMMMHFPTLEHLHFHERFHHVCCAGAIPDRHAVPEAIA